MGQLLYGSPAEAFDVDDRTLAHLQVVILNKLRRNESFAMSLDCGEESGAARESLWMHPAIQVRFRFSEAARPALNREWCEAMMDEACGSRGLSIIDEPTASASALREMPLERRRRAA